MCAQVCVADVGRFSPMHAAVYNPVDSRLIATANAREGVHLFDLRTPRLYTFGILVGLGLVALVTLMALILVLVLYFRLAVYSNLLLSSKAHIFHLSY